MKERDSVSQVSQMRLGESLKPPDSFRGGTTRSARGTALGRSQSRATIAGEGGGLRDTINTAYDRAYNKEGDEVCKWVKLQTFQQIYGHGTEVKFVKLLFLLLKK